MTSLLKSAAIAIAMYSRIPMPVFEWQEEDMRLAIAFFPVVGVITGAAVMGWTALGRYLGVPAAALALMAAVLPILITGGIHVDGFMDTSDALSSYRPREKRLEILKDSHIGAFAVIALMVLSAFYLAGALTLMNSVTAEGLIALMPVLLVWALGFCLSRSLSALSVASFRCARHEGTLYAFGAPAHQKMTRGVILGEVILFAGLMIAADPAAGLTAAGISVLVFFYYRYRSYRDFGGVTGDLAGWFLCLCETGQLLSLALIILIRQAG